MKGGEEKAQSAVRNLAHKKGNKEGTQKGNADVFSHRLSLRDSVGLTGKERVSFETIL